MHSILIRARMRILRMQTLHAIIIGRRLLLHGGFRFRLWLVDTTFPDAHVVGIFRVAVPRESCFVEENLALLAPSS
jgi:hypothetical protein